MLWRVRIIESNFRGTLPRGLTKYFRVQLKPLNDNHDFTLCTIFENQTTNNCFTKWRGEYLEKVTVTFWDKIYFFWTRILVTLAFRAKVDRIILLNDNSISEVILTFVDINSKTNKLKLYNKIEIVHITFWQ